MLDSMTMDRRDLIARMALALGAAALPAEAFAAAANGEDRFLTASQLTLLEAVADTIMPATDTPGALAAGVPARLDGMLANWASPDTRNAILGALIRIDDAARAQKGTGFAALSAADRDAVLRPHDADALKIVPPPANAPKLSFFTQVQYFADPGYHKIKDLVISLYYYSEVATSQELIYEHVPGKFEPSITLTAQSRPYLGTGPF